MSLQLEHSSLIVLFAGLTFLLLGLSSASESLQKLAANQIRKVLNRLDERGLTGVLLGTLLTLMMQSSGALTATLVNLGSARVLTLVQVVGVLIGSAIGAALTVQLLSFHLLEFGLPLVVIGFFGSFIAKKRRPKSIFEFVMGIGMLFFGLELISLGAGALISGPEAARAFSELKSNWLAVLAISAGITSLFQSSTATLGIVLGLVGSGVLSVEEAMIWMYGANIGTTSTALVASIKANYLGRRIAWANFLYRVAAVILFLPFAGFALTMVRDLNLSPTRQIATLYLFLTLLAAAIFYPLRRFGVQIIEKVIVPDEGEQEFGVRFLKRSNYDSFSMGLAHAKREVLEMGDILLQMVELSVEVFRDEDADIIHKIRKLDDRVDLLLKEIKLFLIRVSDLAPEGLNQSIIDVISFGSDLEAAADIIDHHLLDLAKKKRNNRLEFSADGWTDLEAMFRFAVRAVSLSTTYFQTEDEKLAGQLLDLKAETRDLENKSRSSHIGRLGRQDRENIGASAIFLETLNTYLQFVEMVARHAKRNRRSSTKV